MFYSNLFILHYHAVSCVRGLVDKAAGQAALDMLCNDKPIINEMEQFHCERSATF